MALSNAAETAILSLIFQAAAWSGYADNTATSPQTSVAVALHTADPTGAGTQSSNETTYPGYARGSVVRTSSGFAVSGNAPAQASLAAQLNFPACTSGSATISHFSTGKTGGGATPILFSGPVTPNLQVTSTVTPYLTTSTVCTLL